MADMMRSRSWVIVSRTYGTGYSGDFRARSKREARALIEEAQEEIEELRELRQCWNFHYSLSPAWFADRILDRYGIPKPPSRARRMPE
jgi:hypothetical protein